VYIIYSVVLKPPLHYCPPYHYTVFCSVEYRWKNGKSLGGTGFPRWRLSSTAWSDSPLRWAGSGGPLKAAGALTGANRERAMDDGLGK
jgi:hypothetical protein